MDGLSAALQRFTGLAHQAADAVEERLPAAMELLGLDYARLQDEAGHA